jgi:hypothetical protein
MDVTVKLSILWMIVMFDMIYADILAVVGGIETNPFFLFLASIEVLVLLSIIWISVKWKTSELESVIINSAIKT